MSSTTQRSRATSKQRRAPGVAPPEIQQLPTSYGAMLAEIKSRVQSAQTHAALSANRALITLYWNIGREIAQRQRAEGWGTKVIDRLAHDLHIAFPGVAGFSRQNIYRMRAFFTAYESAGENISQPARQGRRSIVSQPARQCEGTLPPEPMASLPWFHNVLLIEQIKTPDERFWYAAQALEHGWSRNVLALQIDNRLHERARGALSNFPATLPPAQSDLAQQVLKDPYVFDFLQIAEPAQEREVAAELLTHITRFLLELGAGFAFVGRQFHLEVDEDDYYLDLLFYHVRLHCFVVVELKTGRFRPEHAGKMNFYLSAVDDTVRGPDDAPSIGLILCRQKRRFSVEYALRDLKKPIGVARWTTKITGALPRHLRGTLPTVRQLEAELQFLSAFAKDHAPAGAAAVSPSRPAKVRTRRTIRRTEVQQPWP